MEPVDVFVLTDVGDPVEGVRVKIYDLTGTTFVTQADSGVDGKASFLLPIGSYSMRFYKFQTGFEQPQIFDVEAAPVQNSFDVVAELFNLPIATDPRLCRCSGFFRDMDGSAKQYLDMHIMSEFDPVILDDAAVISDVTRIKTDERGFASVDLIRGGNYYVEIESMGAEMMRRLCKVPDASSASLPHMLFPVVSRITFDPPGPYSLAVGESLEIVPTVYDSAGRPLTGVASGDVRWSSEDPSVLGLSNDQTYLTLYGAAAGETNILAERSDTSIICIPDTPIEGVPVEVTVT